MSGSCYKTAIPVIRPVEEFNVVVENHGRDRWDMFNAFNISTS